MSGVSRSYALFLALGMVITGSINTLSNAWADSTTARGTGYWHGQNGDADPGYVHKFTHPYLQTIMMFLGEFSCLGVFFLLNWRRRRQGVPVEEPKAGFTPLVLWIPAICDMTATSAMNVGLTMTYPSVFQMLRGAVVLFTGVFSVIFLKRKLFPYHWLGMFLVTNGLLIVGVASVMQGNSSNASNPLVGDILVIAAQFIAACQMVIEEKYLSKYSVPALAAVGCEGMFGLGMMTIVVVVMYFIPGLPGASDAQHMENAVDAFVQISNSLPVAVAVFGNIFSIAFFNFFGISVTKTMSATTRMVLDSIRTVIIWGVSLAVGWQDFQYLQAVGFVILLAGTFVYNKIIPIPHYYFDYRLMNEFYQQADLDEDIIINTGASDKEDPFLVREKGEFRSILEETADRPEYETRGKNNNRMTID